MAARDKTGPLVVNVKAVDAPVADNLVVTTFQPSDDDAAIIAAIKDAFPAGTRVRIVINKNHMMKRLTYNVMRYTIKT